MRYEALAQPGRGGFWPRRVARADRWVFAVNVVPVTGALFVGVWWPQFTSVAWLLAGVSMLLILEWCRRYLLARAQDGPAVAAFAAANSLTYQPRATTQLRGALFVPSLETVDVVSGPGVEFGTSEYRYHVYTAGYSYLLRSYAAVYSSARLPRLVLTPRAVRGSNIAKQQRGTPLNLGGPLGTTFEVFGSGPDFLTSAEAQPHLPALCRAAGRCDIELVGHWALLYYADGPVRSSPEHWQRLVGAAAALQQLIRVWEARPGD